MYCLKIPAVFAVKFPGGINDLLNNLNDGTGGAGSAETV